MRSTEIKDTEQVLLEMADGQAQLTLFERKGKLSLRTQTKDDFYIGNSRNEKLHLLLSIENNSMTCYWDGNKKRSLSDTGFPTNQHDSKNDSPRANTVGKQSWNGSCQGLSPFMRKP